MSEEATATAGGPPLNLEGMILSGSNDQAYTLKKLIGHTSSAAVYLCRDKNGTEYTCMTIVKALLNEQQLRFLAEKIRLNSGISHENVLSMHAVLETDAFIFVIFPYMAGGELLDKVIARKRFSENEAREILVQVAHGLDYLHSLGLFHEDLNLGNILCSEETEHFHVVISGFLPPFFSDQTTFSPCVHYAAPEALIHAVCSNSDIWSFGVITYVLLTGCFPFHAENDSQESLIRLIKDGKYSVQTLKTLKISTPARNFIKRLLVVDPAKRPTVKDVLKDPWLNGTDMQEPDLTETAKALCSLKGGK